MLIAPKYLHGPKSMIEFLKTEQGLFTVAAVMTGLGYILYWVFGNSPSFIGLFTRGEKGSVQEVCVRRTYGFVIMGVIPFLAAIIVGGVNPGALGLHFDPNIRMVHWLIGLGIPAILVNWAAGHNAENRAEYPQIREEEWSPRIFIIEYISWAFYLLGYEFLFRGIFLFASLSIMSVPAAIALNVFVYAFAHLPKGNKETLGSIILGTLLCVATIRTGSMWIAFFVHVIMAWSNSIFSFVMNPRFRYAGK